MKNASKDNIYNLYGYVPLQTAIPLGIQHILAMFLGNVSPLLIIFGLINIEASTQTILIQNAMFVAAIATIIQLYPIWKLGAGLPIVMGTSSGFIGTAKAIATQFGYAAILGASVIGSIFEIILAFFIKPLKKLFPPIVTSLVIISIGLSLLPVGIQYFGGGQGASDFGSWKHLLVGSVVILTIIILKQFKGFINVASILIGIVVGYILAICLKMVDFTMVKEASWFAIPRPFVMGFEFKWEAILPMCIMFIATTVETIGDTSGITNGGLNREATNKELTGSVMADGLGSLLGSCFGVLPNTSFSQNVGLVTTTKVVNKFVVLIGAIFLLILGFFPKISALFTVMPQSVLGGAAVIMFAMIFVSGLQSLFKVELNARNTLIIALSLGLGIGIGNVPQVLSQMPNWVQTVFAQNGIIMVFVIATITNLIFPKDKKPLADISTTKDDLNHTNDDYKAEENLNNL